MRSVPRLVVGFLAVTSSVLSAQGLSFDGSLGLTSGTYIFTERTNTITLLTGLAFHAGPVTFRASMPAYAQNTTLIASGGTGLIPTGGSSSGIVADSSAARQGGRGGRMGTHAATPDLLLSSAAPLESTVGSVDPPPTSVTGYGLRAGDPAVGFSAAVYQGPRVGLLLGMSAKVPVRDTASMGTGAWDVGASASFSLSLGGLTMLGLSGGYMYMGDPPGLDLQNSIMLSTTISHLTLGGWGFSASVMGASPVIAGFSSSVSLNAGILRLGPRGNIGVNAGVGLTETAPDLTIGLIWSLGLLQR